MSNSPVYLPFPQTIIQRINTGSSLYMGGIWGYLKAGQTMMASDGNRFVWSADSMSVVYSQKSKFYVQNSSGFIQEVRTAPFAIAGQKSQFIAHVAEVEMKFLMGIL